MAQLDYCRVMEKIGAKPHDKVDLTVRQFLELKVHVNECHKCSAIIEALNRMYPEKPGIGSKQEPN